MTNQDFNIKKIAIIGSGPGGLTTLNELLHTDKNGNSTLINPSSNSIYPNNPAFDEIVVFEQNDKIGGVWNYSKETDLNFSKFLNNTLNNNDYSKPENLRPHLFDINNEELKNLKNSDKSNPIIIKSSPELYEKYNKLLWNKSGVYDNLFTNIPQNLMRFSTSFNDSINKSNSKIYEPFTTHENVLNYLNDYVLKYDLLKYIRFNSSVEKVYKEDNKWFISVCKFNNELKNFEFYTEKFDAVVISIGRFNIPFYPKIQGMKEFTLNNPNIIIHSKLFRKSNDLINKKVLIVGSSVSALDIAQYLLPICELHISSNSKTISIAAADDDDDNDDKKQNKKWSEKIFSDNSLNWKKHGRILKFDNINNLIEFEDGTIEEKFDKIIFCTGYHLYYPFLDIPENENKEYISISSGFDDNNNYAMTKVDNLYLYTFTISDPTLCHTGIAHNPLFFLTSEANAISIAGVWSNNKKLPSIEIQREFIKNRFKGKKIGFQVYDETSIRDLINECYKLSPNNRFNFLPYINDGEIKKSKEILTKLFYKFSNKELNN